MKLLTTSFCRKHPHVHGEDTPKELQGTLFLETPPRAWGRQDLTYADKVRMRNTPTCMGKTVMQGYAIGEAWKHPHVHGEDGVDSQLLIFAEETPPRAWGRQLHSTQKPVELRNTPTCMGKTIASMFYAKENKKHPHVHGEDEASPPYLLTAIETPPRAWGRLPVIEQRVQKCRNTPTCMGKTLVFPIVLLPVRKHPHVHGEDNHPDLQFQILIETPPRAWGRHRSLITKRRNNRNTPTCMGKTTHLT